VPVSEGAASEVARELPLGTLAEKLTWLIDRAHPAGRGPYSNAELAALVGQVTGEKVSHGVIWELRTGRKANPTKRVIEALAQTFGVPAGFLLDDYGAGQAQLLAGEVELLALIRDAGVDQVQLRAFLALPREAREAMTGLIQYTARAEAARKGRPESG
jgi:transcriptional regulator with XRE-family HTH domain